MSNFAQSLNEVWLSQFAKISVEYNLFEHDVIVVELLGSRVFKRDINPGLLPGEVHREIDILMASVLEEARKEFDL